MPSRTDAQVDSSIALAVKRQARRSLAGFLILSAGLFGAVAANSYENCQARSEATMQISDTIGGILTRLDTANKLQYQKGNVTLAERQMAEKFYQTELDQLPVADKCTIL
jgi:hypothetical protein